MKPRLSLWPRRRLYRQDVFCLIAAVLVSASLVCAQESGEPQPPTDEPTPGATVPPAADPTDAMISETLQLMQQAENRLADSQLDDETARLHERVLKNLEDLLQQAAERAAETVDVPLDEDTDPESQSTEASGRDGAGEPDRRQRGPSDAGDSSEGSRNGDEPRDGDVEQRLDLATSVWGHLPPRTRDRMRGAFSERFLPAYDELVRLYYEALATGEDVVPIRPPQ